MLAKKQKGCDCIVGVHEGHYMFRLLYLKQFLRKEIKKILTDGCCGGVTLFRFCPLCGNRIYPKEMYLKC